MRASHPLQQAINRLHMWNFGYGSIRYGTCILILLCHEEVTWRVRNYLYFHEAYGISHIEQVFRLPP
jgi:hypothetical protein